MRQTCLRRSVVMIGALASIGMSGTLDAAPASAMSCFTIAGTLTCIDSVVPSLTAPLPPVIVPGGAWGEGEDSQIVIEDNGGRRVARG